MSKEAIRRIELLHQMYCQHTGRKVPLDVGRQHAWAYLLVAIDNMDCTPEKAVVLVAQRVKRLVANKQLWPSALDFSRFIGRCDEFQEHLAAALAEARKPSVPPWKAEVLRATGRSAEPPQPEPRPVGTVLESLKLADQLKQWREKNLQ